MHTSLLHYYFDDKKAIFDAVFGRRAAVSTGLRLAALDAYEQGCGGNYTVEGALHAYLDTDLDLYINGGEGWRNYATLGASGDDARMGRQSVRQPFRSGGAAADRSAAARAARLPAREDFWGYHFVTGGLVQTLARTGRIDVLSGGLCKSDDFASIKTYMARFMAAGFLDICRQD